MELRGYTYRAYATGDQERTFAQWCGVCRLVYNLALFQREQFSRKGRWVGFKHNHDDLKHLRAEYDWIGAVSQTAQKNALRDLDQAYKSFFKGDAGYPTERKRKDKQSFRIEARECPVRRLNASWGVVKLPKIGDVRFRWTRDLPDDIRNATIQRGARYWEVVFCCVVKLEEQAASELSVGIDRGVANAIALSTGDIPRFPREHVKALEAKSGAWQRIAARRKPQPGQRGSRRWRKALRRAAVLKARAAACRKHWNHVESTRIAESFGLVAIEDLNVGGMTKSSKGTAEKPGKKVKQKSGFNRSILETGWGQFERLLEYKVASLGGNVVRVNPKNTSRRCRKCGHTSKRNRESQALFRCVECGHEENADVNAAKNIEAAGTRLAGLCNPAHLVEQMAA